MSLTSRRHDTPWASSPWPSSSCSSAYCSRQARGQCSTAGRTSRARCTSPTTPTTSRLATGPSRRPGLRHRPRHHSPSPSTAPSTRPALDPEVEARDRDLREQGNQPRNYIDPRGQIFRATPTRGRYFEQWRDALQSPSAAVRSNAALTLGYFGSQATPVLIQTLKDPSADVRLSAVASLNAIGPGARPAGPALAPLLRDPEQNVRL